MLFPRTKNPSDYSWAWTSDLWIPDLKILTSELCAPIRYYEVTFFFHSFTDFPGRPHSLKIFMQTHAGNQNGRQLFINKILPMFKGASMSVDFLGMLQLLSSLFTGDQCLWLLLVTLAHELSSPRSYTQSFVLYHILIWKIWKLSWLHHQQNKVPRNQGNFGYPKTLTSTNKNDSTVLSNISIQILSATNW